jgi:hypothetical protein
MKKIIFLFLIIFLNSAPIIKSQTIVDWTLATGNAQFGARALFAYAVYDDKLWVIGGRNNLLSLVVKNDVWYSADGVDWVLATGNAQFGNREGATSLSFDNKIWVIGGIDTEPYPNTYYNDVWYSADGVDWVLATGNAQFPARTYFASTVFDNKMWVIGGFNVNVGGYLNDVWYSADGVDWYPSTQNAQFPARSFSSTIVYDNKIWIAFGSSASGFLHDVWYTKNGYEWITTTRNAEFGKRDAGNFININNNNLCIIAGYGDVGAEFDEVMGDVWYSTGGQVWTSGVEGYKKRQEGAACIFDNNIYVFGGYNNATDELLNDVWIGSLSTPVPTPTPSVQEYTASLWSARIYDMLGNTFMAMRNYYGAVSGSAGYGNLTANEQQNIFYRAGLMLINKFKSLTGYTNTVKTISRISNVNVKATAEANFVATMTPVYTLLPEASTHLTRGLNVTKATKNVIKINQGISYINYVATYVASH